MSVTDLTILVNSTDSFEDCWAPFFQLFRTYWAECPYPIVLNTETKDFTFSGLNVRSARTQATGRNGGKPTWSTCLMECLSQIRSPYILYVQEDYFVNAHVDADTVARFTAIMADEGYAHIRLMEVEQPGFYRPSLKYNELWEIAQNAPYRISLQAGLWAVDRLRSYLRPKESAWQFERWGSIRAHRVDDVLLCPNLEQLNHHSRQIFPYVPTGIIRGKWYGPAVVELFRQHGIDIDYSVRGFYRVDRWKTLKQWARASLRRAIIPYL